MSDEGNGWIEYRKLVMKELETHGSCLDVIQKDISQIKTDLELLKAGVYRKAAISGLASGGGISAVAALILYLLQQIGG